MWYIFAIFGIISLYVFGKKWGRSVYYKWNRLIYVRFKIKSRSPTPPLLPSLVSVESDLINGNNKSSSVTLVPGVNTTTATSNISNIVAGGVTAVANKRIDLTVLSMSTDEYHKASVFNSASFEDFVIPDLIGTTEILTEDHREKLCGHLPARAEGYSWSLIFSTLQHGFSLNTLYRKMYKLESPILLVIEDTDNCVFGALTSCSLRVSDLFYGTGESLLYKFNPNFKVFHWTGENLYFIKGNPESLSIGAGDGRFGLWLDGDLNQGRSQRCSTYANDPLAHQEDFVVKTLECWAFV